MVVYARVNEGLSCLCWCELQDAVGEMDVSLENVRDLQVTVKRLGKGDQETLDKSGMTVRRSVKVMRLLTDWVRDQGSDSMEMDMEALTYQQKQLKLTPEVLQQFKVWRLVNNTIV